MLKQSNFGKKYQEEEDSSQNDDINSVALTENISRAISKVISKQSLESGGEEKKGGKYGTVIE